MDTIYIYYGASIILLVLLCFIVVYVMKHKKTSSSSEVLELDSFKSDIFNQDFVSAPNIEPEVKYDNEYGEYATDPITQCHVYMNFGQFDRCHEILNDPKISVYIKPSVLEEMRVWIEHKLSHKHTEALTVGWNVQWNSMDEDPVAEANLFIANKEYETARELLEEALLNSRGDSSLVRIALRDVSKLICSPARR